MIKIEFTGSGDEVRSEMLKLLGLQAPGTSVESAAQADNKEVAEAQPVPVKGKRGRRSRKPSVAQQAVWTEKDAEKLLGEIRPNARGILAELANKPDGYPRSELAQVLGLSDQAIRGRLSSVGSALRRMGKKPSPISNDKIGGQFTYKLNPAVASAVKRYSEHP